MKKQTLESYIGQTVRVFTTGEQSLPCPPNGYLGNLLEVVPNKFITVKCKLGYTNQEKVLQFTEGTCKISKIILEESQKIIYEETT